MFVWSSGLNPSCLLGLLQLIARARQRYVQVSLQADSLVAEGHAMLVFWFQCTSAGHCMRLPRESDEFSIAANDHPRDRRTSNLREVDVAHLHQSLDLRRLLYCTGWMQR